MKNIFKSTLDTGIDCFNQIKRSKNHTTSFTSHKHSSHRHDSSREICSFLPELHLIKCPLEVSKAITINFNSILSFSFNFHFTSTLTNATFDQASYSARQPGRIIQDMGRLWSDLCPIEIDIKCYSHSSGNRPILRVEVPTAKSIVSRDRLKIETAICAKYT